MANDRLNAFKKAAVKVALYKTVAPSYMGYKLGSTLKLNYKNNSFNETVNTVNKHVKDTSKGKTTETIIETLTNEKAANDKFTNAADSIRFW